MNTKLVLIAIALAAIVVRAQAIPSGINYQGVLTDSQGQPVTGSKTMSMKLYDAATGGNLLYTEELGAVSVSKGVFSFEFGTNGTSNAQQSETVAITTGASSSFQKILSASSVVAGSVSVSDGTYTWNQSNGSSNDNDFGVAYSTSLRRVTVTYYNGNPAAGHTITATYRTPALGVSGALSGSNQAWAEVAVNGVAQTPRQKVLAVPFAFVSARSLVAATVESPSYAIISQPPPRTSTSRENTVSGSPSTFGFYSQDVYISPDADILKIKYSAGWSSRVWDGSRRAYVLDVVVKIGSIVVHQFTFNGIAYNLNTFSFEKSVDADALNIIRGYNTFSIEATKRDYGSGNNAVDLEAGGCSFWLIGEPRK